MRPKHTALHSGHGLRKTVTEARTGKGRKHTFSGTEVSSARPRTTGTKIRNSRTLGSQSPPRGRTPSSRLQVPPRPGSSRPSGHLRWRGVLRLRNASRSSLMTNRTTSFCYCVPAGRPLTDPSIWNQEPRLPDALAGRTTWSEHFRWTRALPAAWDQ